MKSRLSEHLHPESFNSTFISTEFSPYVKNQVNNILNHWINDQAVRRVGVEAITIDWINSLDLDDAIWAEKTKTWYCIWIHISDVAEAIPLFSPLDREALQRTTSIYRRDHIINMFPDQLSNWILSLDENGIKKTMTLQIDLDNQGNVKTSSFYESNFRNLKRYNYESFWEDYGNRDSVNHSTLHLFKEISDKLIINRLKNGSVFWFMEDDRRLFLWQKEHSNSNITYGEKISHSIIESFMVLANTTVWDYLVKKWENAIFKQHLWLDERSFYIQKYWKHIWLWVQNYTHFTSPIRRYVDIVIHRIIKAIERGEELPYGLCDLKFISEHVNNTRWKIETIGAHIDFEFKWKQFLEKTENRLGRSPEVFEMKHFIRNNIHKKWKMPNCMKNAIKEKIEISPITTWFWAVWVILFWKDKDMKVFLKEKLLNDNFTKPAKILNILAQTQILSWEKTIFEVRETEEHNKFTSEVYLHWSKISGYSMNTWKLWDINFVKWNVRKKVVERVFDYFIGL